MKCFKKNNHDSSKKSSFRYISQLMSTVFKATSKHSMLGSGSTNTSDKLNPSFKIASTIITSPVRYVPSKLNELDSDDNPVEPMRPVRTSKLKRNNITQSYTSTRASVFNLIGNDLAQNILQTSPSEGINQNKSGSKSLEKKKLETWKKALSTRTSQALILNEETSSQEEFEVEDEEESEEENINKQTEAASLITIGKAAPVTNFSTILEGCAINIPQARNCSSCKKRNTKVYVDTSPISIRTYDTVNSNKFITSLDSPSYDQLRHRGNNESFILLIEKIFAKEALLKIAKSDPNFTLKWAFLDIRDSMPFNINSFETDIMYEKVYHFNISEASYIFMLKCPIPLELYIIRKGRNDKLLATAMLKLDSALMHINETIHTKLFINNKDLSICYNKIKRCTYGEIECRYSLRGDSKSYNAFKPKTPPPRQPPTQKSLNNYSSLFQSSTDSRKISEKLRESSGSLLMIENSEMASFQEGLNLVLVRNKALRTTQDEISNELKERTNWMHEELKWRLTLQEHAILSGKDPKLIKWRQWKDDSTAKVKYQPLLSEDLSKYTTGTIGIKIIELQLPKNSRVYSDNSITRIYVEYTFLYSGARLETISKLKTEDKESIVYNYDREFIIHRHERNAKVLADMIKNNEDLTFTVVSEPVERLEVCQTCKELGFCNIKLFEIIQCSADSVTKYFPVMDAGDRDAVLGRLKISIRGIISIRALALYILTPNSFRIIK